jgi:hypothetical protein
MVYLAPWPFVKNRAQNVSKVNIANWTDMTAVSPMNIFLNHAQSVVDIR